LVLPLYSSISNTKIRHLAELAFSTFRGVKRNDMVSNADIGNALSYRLDNSSTLMATNNRERAFGILARESVGIGVTDLQVSSLNK
jgi:hypothetical protein